MIRTSLTRLALVLVPLSASAQDWREDDSIWGFGDIGGPHRDGPRPVDPPSIVPTSWLAVPTTADEPALLVVPWILDPERAAPRQGEGGWTANLTSPLGAAACAFTTIVADADEVRMARLSGARWLVVNDSAHIGDPERRGDRGVPVALKKGLNRLFVVDATEGWELELWKPATRLVIGTWDVGWPHATGNVEDVEYPVFNASLETARQIHVHYGHAEVEPAAISLTDWRDGGLIAPLALLVRAHYLYEFGGRDGGSPIGSRSPVCVYDGEDPEAAREILSDRDASYARTRLEPGFRARGRVLLSDRPQGRIPRERPVWPDPAKAIVLVYGTHGSPEENAALLARARFDQQVLWYACGEAPWLLTDSTFVEHANLEGEAAKRSQIYYWIDRAEVVFYGNRMVNGGWGDWAARVRAIEVAAGFTRRVQAPEEGSASTVQWRGRADGDPITKPGPKLGFASTGVAGARLSLALGMLADREGIHRVDAQSKSGFSAVPTPK